MTLRSRKTVLHVCQYFEWDANIYSSYWWSLRWSSASQPGISLLTRAATNYYFTVIQTIPLAYTWSFVSAKINTSNLNVRKAPGKWKVFKTALTVPRSSHQTKHRRQTQLTNCQARQQRNNGLGLGWLSDLMESTRNCSLYLLFLIPLKLLWMCFGHLLNSWNLAKIKKCNRIIIPNGSKSATIFTLFINKSLRWRFRCSNNDSNVCRLQLLL